MGKVEETIQKILTDLKESRFKLMITKKELILIIIKYSMNAYSYLNRLEVDGYVKMANDKAYEIVTLEYKEGVNA